MMNKFIPTVSVLSPRRASIKAATRIKYLGREAIPGSSLTRIGERGTCQPQLELYESLLP